MRCCCLAGDFDFVAAAGYYSTTAKIKDKKSPTEQALAAVGSFECLELLEKVGGGASEWLLLEWLLLYRRDGRQSSGDYGVSAEPNGGS